MPDRHHSFSHASADLDEGQALVDAPAEHYELRRLLLLVRERPEALSDEEFEAELTVAAMAPGRARWERYERLLCERVRRFAA